MTTNGNQLLELCKAVVEADNEDLQTAAASLLVAYIFNNMDIETMQAAHRFAVSAGYDFSEGTDAP